MTQTQAATWKDIDDAHEHLVVHMDSARTKAFDLCKEETSFVHGRVLARLNGASSRSYKNLMNIFFGPQSNIWMAIEQGIMRERIRKQDPTIQMSHEEFMKNLCTFFLSAAYNQVSNSSTRCIYLKHLLYLNLTFPFIYLHVIFSLLQLFMVGRPS
jgi:hypothetical protein